MYNHALIYVSMEKVAASPTNVLQFFAIKSVIIVDKFTLLCLSCLKIGFLANLDHAISCIIFIYLFTKLYPIVFFFKQVMFLRATMDLVCKQKQRFISVMILTSLKEREKLKDKLHHTWMSSVIIQCHQSIKCHVLSPLSPNIHIQILQTGLYTFP